MGVSSRVAMPRKVFCRYDHAVALRTLDEGRNETAHGLGILSVGSNINYRIRRVVVDVSHRRVNLLHAQGPCLARGYHALTARVVGVVCSADRHVPGKIYGVVETHSGAGFK